MLILIFQSESSDSNEITSDVFSNETKLILRGQIKLMLNVYRYMFHNVAFTLLGYLHAT